MFSNLFQTNYQYIGFEDILIAIKEENKHIILNTLSHDEQNVLIKNTILSTEEENIINSLIDKNEHILKTIIIYGKHNCDNETENKYKKLKKCGFTNINIYKGGLFEWLLLQEVYGFSNFPTSSRDIDILKYRPPKVFGNNLLTY